MASRKDFAKDSERMAALKAAYAANVASKGSPDFADLDARFGFWNANSGKKNNGYWTWGILVDAGVHVSGKGSPKPPAPAPVPVPVPDVPVPEQPPEEHVEFQSLMLIVKANVNVMMIGPAGSGKTTAAMKIAEKLGLDFDALSICAQSSKADLVGFNNAAGVYMSTSFRKLYENGGVFLLDEVDAGNANVLVLLNAAIANGQYTFPDGKKVMRHPNFRCIAAANTYGLGADRIYVGRNQLDGATLTRFVKLDWDYDEAHELRISSVAAWTRHVQKARRAASRAGLRIIISPRDCIHGGILLNAGMAWAKVEQVTFLAGLDAASVQKIRSGMGK